MSDVFTGCRARFSLDGIKMGYATGVSARESIQWEPINVLDTIQTKEHAPVGYEVSLTADMIRIVGDTLKQRGFFAKQGSSPEQHLRNIIAGGEMVATLEDNETGDVVAVCEGVRIAEQNVTISARGVVGQNVSFVALRFRDESDADGSS